MEDAEKNENQQNNGEVEDFGFHSSQIGQKPEPVYFVNVEERPITRLKKFISAKRKILMISGASVVGVTVLVVLGIVFLPQMLKGPKLDPDPGPEYNELGHLDKVYSEAEEFLSDEEDYDPQDLIKRLDLAVNKYQAEGYWAAAVMGTSNIARIHVKQHKYQEAFDKLEEAIKRTERPGEKVAYLLEINNIYTKLNNKKGQIGTIKRMLEFPEESVISPDFTWAGDGKVFYELKLKELEEELVEETRVDPIED